MADVTQSTILAKLRNRAKGSYERAKTVEAKVGGRSLPGNLKNCIGQVTRIKLQDSEKTGQSYAYIYASTVETVGKGDKERTQYRNYPCGQLYNLGEDQFNTFDDNFNTFIAALKCLGYAEQVEGCSEEEFFVSVLPWIIEDMNARKPYFVFETSNKPKNDGTFNIWPKSPAPADYQPPVRETTNDHAAQGYQPVSPPKPTAPGKPKPTPPGAKKPGPKGPPRPKGPPKSKSPVKLEERAMTIGNPFGDGETYRGLIKSLNEASEIAGIDFGDGQLFDVPFANIASDDGKEETASSPSIDIGSTVKTHIDYFGDGTSYEGKVEEVNDGLIKVNFGTDTIDVPLDQLTLA